MSVQEKREPSPAGAIGIQSEYRKELERRLRDIRGTIRETIVKNNALRIKGGTEPRVQQDTDPREEFEFEQDPTKQVEFRQQLQEWLEEGFLEPAGERDVENGQHYSAIYVNAAAAEGVRFADQRLQDEGITPTDADPSDVVTRPIYESTLERIYTRNFQQLEGITEDIDRQVSKVLTEAIRDGWGTRRTADRMTKEIRDIQHSRARTLARTEMMNTHNETTLERYREFDVQEVEILTHTPCPICREIESNDPYPISEAPRIPLDTHPNCVCTYAPVI